MSQLRGVAAMPKSGGDRSKMTMTRKELETAASIRQARQRLQRLLLLVPLPRRLPTAAT